MSDTIATTASAPDDLFATTASTSAPGRFAWSTKAKPLRGLAGWLRGGLHIYILGKASLILSVIILLWMFTEIAAGSSFDGPGPQLLASIAGVAGEAAPYIQVGTYLLCVILYLRFIYRAIKNLDLSRAKGVSVSPGWAVGWSFIPFANLGMIFSVMKQAWVGSSDPARGVREPPATMGWWWGLFLVGNIIGTISDRLAPTNVDGLGPQDIMPAFLPSLATSMLSSVLLIGSSILLMGIVRQVTQAQEALSSMSVFEE